MSLKIYHLTLFLLCTFILVSCRDSVSISEGKPYDIVFLDEYIFSNDSIIPGSVIGGLSGIDYDPVSELYNIVCDDAKNPRFYTADIKIDGDRFSEITFRSSVTISAYEEPLEMAKVLDLESIRKTGNQLLLSSEGTIKYGYHPSIFVTDISGNYQYAFQLPSYFLADSLSDNRPRHNAVFEGLAIDSKNTGFWTAMELPLLYDGEEPSYENAGAPTRITHFDTKTKKADTQFAYPLDALTKDPKGKFGVNGITALLALDTDHFLVLERGFVAGHGTQGNTVRIYLADITKATNTLETPVLKNKTIITATKTLLFDFESVRDQLTNNIIDNLEGITFGPILSNGNPSLILVSDNNFNPPILQLNQFLLMEFIKK